MAPPICFWAERYFKRAVQCRSLSQKGLFSNRRVRGAAESVYRLFKHI